MSSRILPLATCLVGLTGCMLESTPILPAPIPASEQQFSVLEIVQPGTDREEAVARLNEAGIHGSFGATGAKSVYYCDVWNREDGERWHLDVAVLFDDRGRVINTRVGDSMNGGVKTGRPRSLRPAAIPAPTVAPAVVTEAPASTVSASEVSSKSRWNERRTAFAGE